jgi:hypothetical protein
VNSTRVRQRAISRGILEFLNSRILEFIVEFSAATVRERHA